MADMKTVPVPQFSGKMKDYPIWSIKFKVRPIDLAMKDGEFEKHCNIGTFDFHVEKSMVTTGLKKYPLKCFLFQ
eukprot:CAMPEP_0116026966 /NCGR_PEP_ID=MMETSP0321-20121206/14281_1 /TAXON_ID=163516 /ORGANISM="Leptocylindrus danicus var. danicus, Strain B650" /LENGTH=73 /DNA_ID=CAMNT_0003500097 /DNA_START=639 /DNA_END=860 /DNA_ORIENTATION=+